MNQGPISTQSHLRGSVNRPVGVNLQAGEWYLKAFSLEGQWGRCVLPHHTSGGVRSCTFHPSTNPLFLGICHVLCFVASVRRPGQTGNLLHKVTTLSHIPAWMASKECC